jgi:hypothetical protein
MRKLVWLVGIVAVLWSGYWGAGTYAIRKAAMQGIDEATSQGNFISPDVAMAGFPTAFDMTLERLDIGNPDNSVRWQSPSVQVQAATWRPWHVVALLNDEHVFTTLAEEIRLVADDARASVTVTPDTGLALSQAAITLTRPNLQSSLGWHTGSAVAELHVNLLTDSANSYAINLHAADILIDPVLLATTGLEPTIPRIAADATVTLSAPLDRMAGETQPKVTSIALSNAILEWGEVNALATGQIAANADGLAEGRIDITIKGWRKLIPVLVATGAITPEVAPTVTGFLNAMASQGGDPETLILPLVYQNGVGTLGPLPLGPAPRMD